ncbi:MAG: sigma-70 family RNA polymerase sigma factor, partial [Opitutaceae bacterium]
AHLAQDVTQGVFIALAKSARSLVGRPALTGWLYTTTRFTAAKVVRERARRRVREQETYAMNELMNTARAEPPWDELRPVLDDAMHELSDRDREAILLRHFEGRSLAEVGAVCGLSENAARMRVERALEKLRARLGARRITSTVSALAAALSTQAVSAAPMSVATATATAAAAALAGATSSMSTGIRAWFSNAKIAAVGVAVSAGAGWFWIEASQIDAQFTAQEASFNATWAREQTERRRLAEQVAKVAATTPEATSTGVDPAARLRAVAELMKGGALGAIRWSSKIPYQASDEVGIAELFALTPAETTNFRAALARTREEISAAAVGGALTHRSGADFVIEVRSSNAARESYGRLGATLREVFGEERYGYLEEMACAQMWERSLKRIGLADVTYVLSRAENSGRPQARYELAQIEAGSAGRVVSAGSRESLLVVLGPLSALVPADL